MLKDGRWMRGDEWRLMMVYGDCYVPINIRALVGYFCKIEWIKEGQDEDPVAFSGNCGCFQQD